MAEESSSFKKAERSLKDWASLFRKDPLKWFFVNLIWLGPTIALGVGNFWGVGSVKQELREVKQDRDAARTQLAPFLAVANLQFTNAPSDKRLDLLLDMMRNITNVFQAAQERTAGIKKLPNGQTLYGDMASGIPTVVVDEARMAIQCFNGQKFDDALAHSKIGIEAQETSHAAISIGGIAGDGEALMYLVGAASAVRLNNKELAEKWVLKAAKLKSTPENILPLVATLQDLGHTNEIQKLLKKLLAQRKNSERVRFSGPLIC